MSQMYTAPRVSMRAGPSHSYALRRTCVIHVTGVFHVKREVVYMTVLYACVWMYHCPKYGGLSCRVASHLGSIQSDLCVATGFGPFNLLTRGSLQLTELHVDNNNRTSMPCLIMQYKPYIVELTCMGASCSFVCVKG